MTVLSEGRRDNRKEFSVLGAVVVHHSCYPATSTSGVNVLKQLQSGNGEFQVDGDVFPVEEGSVVRVAPAGKRSVRNNGTEPLVMLCVQYRDNTFTDEDAADGNILNEPVKW